jgi:hypothetical protein
MTMLVSNDRQSKRAPESVILSALLDILQTETPRASDFIAQGCDAAPRSELSRTTLRWGRAARDSPRFLWNTTCVDLPTVNREPRLIVIIDSGRTLT